MHLNSGVDLVEEFRLRRWARENYVASEGRSAGWHPVILEEMERRDAEFALLEGPSIGEVRFFPNRRVDKVYGPHEIRPFFEAGSVVTREMHYT
ncbi:hypothetical protein Pan44_25530 [Caulifigura coniformis]|uniref:Uncharacterized protein n=1 Tax=Caulifigura coniformis TaxID=2527983 RepID=A0A517SEG5_9PLAN|nr:hypothetical protein [Caulifigura coniformis]QDT54520.1 hypothetical protein Pan44_25530 [Caulifigura coniformis]